MAEKDIIEAVKTGKALAKGPPKPKRKYKKRVAYFPIGRTITTIGGVFQMVNMRYVAAGVKFLMNGEFENAGKDFARVFDGGDIKKGAGIIAGGVVLGKALDAANVNPRLKMAGWGVKLV